MKLRYHRTNCIYSPLVAQERQRKREKVAAETGRSWKAKDEAKARHDDKAEACRENKANIHSEAEAEVRRVEAEAHFMANEAKDYNTCNCTWIDRCTHGVAKTKAETKDYNTCNCPEDNWCTCDDADWCTCGADE